MKNSSPKNYLIINDQEQKEKYEKELFKSDLIRYFLLSAALTLLNLFLSVIVGAIEDTNEKMLPLLLIDFITGIPLNFIFLLLPELIIRYKLRKKATSRIIAFIITAVHLFLYSFILILITETQVKYGFLWWWFQIQILTEKHEYLFNDVVDVYVEYRGKIMSRMKGTSPKIKLFDEVSALLISFTEIWLSDNLNRESVVTSLINRCVNEENCSQNTIIIRRKMYSGIGNGEVTLNSNYYSKNGSNAVDSVWMKLCIAFGEIVFENKISEMNTLNNKTVVELTDQIDELFFLTATKYLDELSVIFPESHFINETSIPQTVMESKNQILLNETPQEKYLPIQQTTADIPSETLSADEARLAELTEEIKKIPVAKVKKWHEEGKLTDEQYKAIARKYNSMLRERDEIQERMELLKNLEK